jgi:hypothetical protein
VRRRRSRALCRGKKREREKKRVKWTDLSPPGP